MKPARCALSLILLLFAGGAVRPLRAQDAARLVRVRVMELHEPTLITVRAHGGTVLVQAGDFDDPIAELRPGEEATFNVAARQVYIRQGTRGLYTQTARLTPTTGAAMEVSVTEGKNKSKPYRYPGRLYVDVDPVETFRLALINELELEDYVAAVVSREYGFDDREGMKAMAVLVRTYALSTSGKYGTGYDQVDHTRSQLYQGMDAVTPALREAVRMTAGEVLTYKNELIQAVYFSSSGGHTADNESVWQSAAVPYLRGRPDPYDTASPHTSWRATISRPRLLELLSSSYGFEVTGFHLGDKGPDDRVQTVLLLKKDGSRQPIRANDFRMLILKAFGNNTLKSTIFTARRLGETYEFEGRGHGHGVGLSQWGAHELARQGKTYREIIDFYYTDVSLTRIDQVGKPKPPPAPSRVVTKEVTPAAPSRGRIGW